MKKRILKSYYLSLILLLSIGCQVQKNGGTSDTQDVVLNDSLQLQGQIDSAAEDYVNRNEGYQAAETKLFDLIHTKLEVSFDWENQYLNGTATLELRPYFYPQSDLLLDAQNFTIHSVSLIDSIGKNPLKYNYDDDIINIKLDKEYRRDENFFVEIIYTAKPYENPEDGMAAPSSEHGLYFINPNNDDPDLPQQIWTQGETEENSWWFPTIDAPNQRTTQEMYITVEERFTTLSNGTLIYSQLNEDNTRTDYWKMEKAHAPYLFMMAIGEYAVVADRWEDMDVEYYVEPSYEEYAMDIFGNTPEMLAYFSEVLDYKYPWEKYAQVVVRNFISGAMENTTASVFMEAVQATDRELLDNNWDMIIAHELIHHWFGNLVTCESWANLPLNESFANYGEYLWAEHKYGKDEADLHGLEELETYLNEAEDKQVDLIRYYYEDENHMFDSHSYAKGGRILHMLRNYVGDDAFFASLSHYLKENEYSAVEIHDLRLAFEEITGEDLNWFFNQWFLSSGHPVLQVSSSYENNQLTLLVDQVQDFSNSPVYTLPLYVDLYNGDEKERYAIIVDEVSNQFVFETTAQPSLIDFDAEKQLLAEISYEKSIAEFAFQYRNTEKFLSRYEAVTALSEDVQNDTARTVLLEALNDPFWGIRQEAIAAFNRYSGENSTEIQSQIVLLAKNDEKSLVRADAIATLASLEAEQFKDVFTEGLSDPSYAVIGASIYGYAQTSAEDKEAIFEEYKDIDNINVIIPLADFYALEGTNDAYSWFTTKINNVQGGNLYYLLQYFAQYLMKSPADQQIIGAKILEDYAVNHETFYVRLAAFQGILLLEEVEGVSQMIERIKEKEKDERLQQIYSNY